MSEMPDDPMDCRQVAICIQTSGLVLRTYTSLTPVGVTLLVAHKASQTCAMIGMLTRLCKRRKFAYQVLVCLRFLKRQKVLHCDLKPENILLKESGRSGIKVRTFSRSPHHC